ncbi:short-chain dehydrogenase [Niastella sp. OAS944]|jgi:hypothetical protein|uniref:short-chain dehydrogenase n=1 Tax=Niastella sp. OAS944 TaxID=2664089 RepID=UPI00348993B9|nr:hypothetical protein [Chitinophagaceae bacterium OAS944]
MTVEQIDTFLRKNKSDKRSIKINFKTRDAFIGMFVKAEDYDHLKGKNFWRIIIESNIKQYLSSKDTSLTRIFHGTAFVKLSVVENIG